MNIERFSYLFNRYEASSITDDERAELLGWFASYPNKELINEYFMAEMRNNEPGAELKVQEWQPVIDKILTTNFPAEQAVVQKMFAWKKWVAAAAIILLLGAGSYFFLFDKGRKPGELAGADLPSDVKAPATNRAMIVLANGDKIYLDSAANGELAQQGNIKLVKLDNGQIEYRASPPNSVPSLSGTSQGGELIQYNTLSNPRGSKVIDMQLADGSHVWLNAGSSVTYPIAFVSNERRVSITGEAYFEIAKDASKKFIVEANGTTTEVLGTHFNINSYEDEDAVKVTLLEGSVKVKSDVGSQKSEVMIKPGEQAVLFPDSRLTTLSPDLDQTMSWKNGIFHFENENINFIMKELSRWYDAEVIFDGPKPGDKFSGIINRNNNLSQVLKMLEQTKRVKFVIENRKIIVSQ